MDNSAQELVFSYLAEKYNQELFQEPPVEQGDNLERIILEDIVPDQKKDYKFFQRVWPDIATAFLAWNASQTHDGQLFIELMQNQITLSQFLNSVKNLSFLCELRKKIYERCFRLVHTKGANEDDSFSYDLLSELYRNHDVKLLTRDLQPAFPQKYLDDCEKYYKDLGYDFTDGVAINKSSLFVLTAEDKIPLTPATFNLGVLPWVLEDSISLQTTDYLEPKRDLQEYGWRPQRLINELLSVVKDGREALNRLNLERLELLHTLYFGDHSYGLVRDEIVGKLLYQDPDTAHLGRMSITQLVMSYRIYFGTDGYIDWDMVLKYRYICKKNLRTIAFETFGLARDLTEDLSYKELIDRLKLMSSKSLEVEEKARYIIENERGDSEGRVYKGLAYLLRASTEDIDKSFWYPDLDGNMKLLFKGNPIPDSLVNITYKTYLWAYKRRSEISVGYFVMIAQRLGIWKVIINEVERIDSVIICEAIARVLQELVPIYERLEREAIEEMNASLEELSEDDY